MNENQGQEEAHPESPGHLLKLILNYFQEVNGDSGLRSALEALALMMYNLTFMLRNGSVTIVDSGSYMFEWRYSNFDELHAKYMTL